VAPAAAPPLAVAPLAAIGLPLLLAEDNPVNQRVAVHMLNRLGHAVDVVDNGALAVAAAASRDYALLLMDCQMPEMDGFAAARAIRDAEKSGARRLPIVAMTANAQQGDREKCLAAGMDDYIAKPVDSVRLAAVLAVWLPRHTGTAATAMAEGNIVGPVAADVDPPAIDLQRLTYMFGAEDAVIDELLTIFQQSLDQLRTRLGREVREHGHDLRGVAHELRGTALNIGALPLAGLAEKLEALAGEGRRAGVEPLAAAIERELIRADDFVSRYLARRNA
jgi:CheY-like chemotaxis protein